MKLIFALIALAAGILAAMCAWMLAILPASEPALGPFALLAMVALCVFGMASYAVLTPDPKRRRML